MTDNTELYKVTTDNELEQSLRPEVLLQLKATGFAAYTENGNEYFFMRSDKKLVDYRSTQPLCYTAGICDSNSTNNSLILCNHCVGLFVRSGSFSVDLIECAVCNDCSEQGRSIKIHKTGRQLCIPCFRISLDKVRQKK